MEDRYSAIPGIFETVLTWFATHPRGVAKKSDNLVLYNNSVLEAWIDSAMKYSSGT